MGNLDGLEKWEQQEVEDNFQHNKFYYFTREMNVGASCLKSYRSHIFVQIYRTQRELEDNWKEVNHYIALKYQCKLEEIIEKSNFYLCLFVKGKVNLKIKSEIEGNSFCAKKYIFEESGEDLEDCLRCVENKIFRINISVFPKQFPMLESMVLQNFRGYAGKFTVNLKNMQKKAASFVVIFAKNGVGKTSFFDGVEFALKGEVGRILDLASKDKNAKYRDAIYRNRDNADKDAFILMKLNDGRIIERRVSKISEEKNDMRANPPIHGKEITGTQTDKEKWDQIILPHDKIDSFISAKSTTAQYKEWVKSVEPLKQETEAFEKSYSVYRKEQRTHNELKDSYDDIEKKLKELSELKNSVNKVYELVELYNSMVSNKHSLYFTKDADVEQYDKLLNCIKKNIRILDDKKNSLDSNITLARGVLNKGVSSCYEVIKSVGELKESLQILETRIRRRQELDVLLEENSENTYAVNKNQKELELLQNMVNYGIEEIKDKNKTYCDIEKKINELKETLDYFSTELMKSIETVNKVKVKREKLKFSQLTPDKYEESLKKIKVIERNNKEIKDLQEKSAAASDRSRQYQKSIIQIYDKIEEIDGFILPKDIKELKLKDISNIGYDLDENIWGQLHEFEENYRNISMQIQLCQEELLKQEKRTKELKEIRQKGQEYLNTHKDVNKCPLCHTSFENWKDLFLSITNIQSDDNLFKRLEGYNTELKMVSEKYSDFYLKTENRKEEQKAEQKVKIVGLENANKECLDRIEEAEKRIEFLNEQQNQLKLWFNQQNIQINEFSFQELESFKRTQEEYLMQLEEELKKSIEAQNSVQLTVENTRKVIDTLIEQKDMIVENSELYSYIKFWMSQSTEFDFDIWLHEKESLLEKYIAIQKKLQEKINGYKDVENFCLLDSIEKRDTQLKNLQKAVDVKEKYRIFENFSEEGINKSLKEWIQEKQYYETQEEILFQISEENSSRSYFEYFRRYHQELEEKKKQCSDQAEKVKQAKKWFEKQKKNLEIRIKAYFDQSIMNEIYKKIDPHDYMKNIEYKLSFNDKDEPQLCIYVNESKKDDTDSYRPEWYFSTAQLNTVAFSSFLNRALNANNLEFRTIFIDDPIGHFDDMNILGFADLIRSILESIHCQIIMSTHDEKIFKILERKLDDKYYNSCFIRLPESEAIIWEETN